MIERRQFLQAAAVSVAAIPAHAQSKGSTGSGKSPAELDTELTRILDAPVLDLKHLTEPVKIESIQLLKEGKLDAFASTGNTGAMMVGNIFSVKPISGRAIASRRTAILNPAERWRPTT